jgi:glycosyltransferase involved in cell wall biosynthesis
MAKAKVVFLSSNEPLPTFTRKLDLLDRINNFEVYLVHWHRTNSLITMPIHSDITREKIHAINLPEPRGNLLRQIYYYIVFFFKARKIIQRLNPSIIHANNMDMLFTAYLMIIGGLKCKLVLDLIDTREIFISNPFRFISRWLIKRTGLIFITSPGYLSDFLHKLGSSLDSKVLFVPNAPSENDFRGFVRKRENNSLHIGYFGFLRGEETIVELIETIKRLNKENLKIKIIFAGVGVCRQLVTNMARKYDFVEYKGPFRFNDSIKKLYESVDLIFSMYYLDHNKKIHMSCRYSESVVCNLPIIVQKGSFMADLVGRDRNGYVLKLGEWDNLYRLLRHVYFHKDELDEKSKNCEKIKAENLFDNYEYKILDAYSKIT